MYKYVWVWQAQGVGDNFFQLEPRVAIEGEASRIYTVICIVAQTGPKWQPQKW